MATHCDSLSSDLLYICFVLRTSIQKHRRPNQSNIRLRLCVTNDKKLKTMNINPSSIARDRTASTLGLPNNPRRAPCKITGFRSPDVGPLRTMHNVNHGRATTSMVTERKPLAQNSKTPERQTIVRPEPATASAKPALPPPSRTAQNPGGELCAVGHFPQKQSKPPLKSSRRRLKPAIESRRCNSVSSVSELRMASIRPKLLVHSCISCSS